MTAAQVENWDDDDELQGDIFSYSVSTVQTAASSRMSVNSESNVGEEDWHVPITPNDENSTTNAISSAKQAGVPIPINVPTSALLGGSIKKLGKKKSRPKVEDDWGEDLELPATGGVKLKLNSTSSQNQLPTPPLGDHDDLDWADGSLGIRSAGTRRDARARSSSVSAMSPSMNSCITFESEEDGMEGLVLPEGPLDLTSRLQKLKEKKEVSAIQQEQSSHPTQPQESQQKDVAIGESQQEKARKDENEDFTDGIDFDLGSFLDRSRHKINRNIKVNVTREQQPATSRVATTLTFTDKPTMSRIPRPKPSRLDPVYESGAPLSSQNRPGPTTTSAQLLRSKRSAPALRGHYPTAQKSSTPFLPAGASSSQSHHINAKPSPYGPRRDSDPSRPLSPSSSRPYSRMSFMPAPETPSRGSSKMKTITPSSHNMRDNAGYKKTLTRPTKRRHFGDGTELEIFDDLPTSATKENKFVKAPLNRMGSKQNLRRQPSISKLPLPDRMTTPLPTPTAPTGGSSFQSRMENLPRFARDTAASRNAREQRLATSRSRGEGPLMPVTTNWKAQVAARNPHTSPSAMRSKRKGPSQRPLLINPMNSPTIENRNGMVFNPVRQQWEGNEDALTPFMSTYSDTYTASQSQPTPSPLCHTPHRSGGTTATPSIAPAPPSPPRPALISKIAPTNAVRVEGGMIFDPRRMCWIKLDRASRGPQSQSGTGTVDGDDDDDDDDDDPFAGLDDLKDDAGAGAASDQAAGGKGTLSGQVGGSVGSGGGKTATAADDWLVGEEFDLGPEFIRRQREEEGNWRKRVDAWTGPRRQALGEDWRWIIRRWGLEQSRADAEMVARFR